MIDKYGNEAEYPLIETTYKFNTYQSEKEALDDITSFSRYTSDGRIENHCLSAEPFELFEQVALEELHKMNCIKHKEDIAW